MKIVVKRQFSSTIILFFGKMSIRTFFIHNYFFAFSFIIIFFKTSLGSSVTKKNINLEKEKVSGKGGKEKRCQEPFFGLPLFLHLGARHPSDFSTEALPLFKIETRLNMSNTECLTVFDKVNLCNIGCCTEYFYRY